MTRNEARKLLARESLLMSEHDGTSTLDGDKTLEVIDQIFDEHGEQLQDKDDEIELLKCRIEEAMKPKTCEWYKEDEEDWRGQCGCIWGFNGENPTMAEAYFCPQCGGKILVPHKKKKGYNVY